jgi:hypothetical protein
LSFTSKFLEASEPAIPADLCGIAPTAAKFAAETASAPEARVVLSKPAVIIEYKATEAAGIVSGRSQKKKFSKHRIH